MVCPGRELSFVDCWAISQLHDRTAIGIYLAGVRTWSAIVYEFRDSGQTFEANGWRILVFPVPSVTPHQAD